jgi:acyl phosphate:glycerol-3-phosphate acyltransferase
LTGAGALLIISPLTFLIAAVTTISTIAISRFVSLGSIVGSLTSIVCGILFFIFGRLDPTLIGKVSLAQMVYMVVGPALVIIFHYDNIGRLLAGTERRIGQKVNAEEQSTPTNGTSSKVQT